MAGHLSFVVNFGLLLRDKSKAQVFELRNSLGKILKLIFRVSKDCLNWQLLLHRVFYLSAEYEGKEKSFQKSVQKLCLQKWCNFLQKKALCAVLQHVKKAF